MICNWELYDRKPNSAVQSQQSRKMIKFQNINCDIWSMETFRQKITIRKWTFMVVLMKNNADAIATRDLKMF